MNYGQDGVYTCSLPDLPGVIRLVDEAMRQHTDQSMLTDYPLVYEKENLKHISIMKKDGVPVSVVPFVPHPVRWAGTSFLLGIISPTATDPAHRRKGHGRACLRHCIDNMRQRGVDAAVLWTMPQTFAFYETESFAPVANVGHQLSLSTSDASHFHNKGFVIHRAGLADISAISAMHRKDTSPVQRSEKRAGVLFSLPKTETWIARQKVGPAAYLTVGHGVNKPGIIEAGGDEDGIEALLKHVLCASEQDRLLRVCLHDSNDALSRVVRKSIDREAEPLQAGEPMMRINRLEPFFQKLKPFLEKTAQKNRFAFSIETEQATVGFESDGETLVIDERKRAWHVVMDTKRLSAAVFGARHATHADCPEPMRSLLPVSFPIWILDRS